MTDKVKVKVKELHDAVAFVKPFIAERHPNPSYSNMAWVGKTLLAYDGSVGAAIKAPASSPGKKGVVIEGTKMLDFLTALPQTSDVEINFTDKSIVLSVKGGSRAVFRYAVADDAKFAFPKWPERKDFKKAPEGFARMLRQAEFCTTTSVDLGPLGSICIEDDNVWGSDGARMTQVKLPKAFLKGQILVPLKAIKHLDRDPARILHSENLLWFAWEEPVYEEEQNKKGETVIKKDKKGQPIVKEIVERGRIWSRLIEPPYPSLGKVLEQAADVAKKAPRISYDSKEMEIALQAVISAGGIWVEGTLDGDKVTFRCAGNLTEIKINKKATDAKGEAKFYAHPEKLKDAFARFSKLAICEGGLLYFTKGEADAEHVLMQMTVDKETMEDDPTGF